MNIRITLHAISQARDRGISLDLIDKTVRDPEAVSTIDLGRIAMMRRYHDTELQKEMVLRVIVEQTPEELVVLTAFKTSRIGRYLKGLN